MNKNSAREALGALVNSVCERSDAFNEKLLVVPREAYREAVRVLDEFIDKDLAEDRLQERK